MKLPRHEAAHLAEQITDALRPALLQIVTDFLVEPDDDDDELSAKDLARIERSAARWRRKLEGLPPEKKRAR